MMVVERDPAEIRVIGTFRLAKAIHDEISKAPSVSEACKYLLDLLPLLLDADAMSIELSSPVSASSFRTPEPFFSRPFATGGKEHTAESLEMSYALMIDGQSVGSMRMFYTHPSVESGPHGMAVLEFAAACLSRYLVDASKAEAKLASLSTTERRVLALFDRTTGEILDRLSISHETFRTHCKNIYRKLGVHNRQDALAVASLAKCHS